MYSPNTKLNDLKDLFMKKTAVKPLSREAQKNIVGGSCTIAFFDRSAQTPWSHFLMHPVFKYFLGLLVLIAVVFSLLFFGNPQWHRSIYLFQLRHTDAGERYCGYPRLVKKDGSYDQGYPSYGATLKKTKNNPFGQPIIGATFESDDKYKWISPPKYFDGYWYDWDYSGKLSRIIKFEEGYFTDMVYDACLHYGGKPIDRRKEFGISH